MYKSIALFSIIALFTFGSLYAQDRPGNTEIGIILGEPTGVSAKLWTGGNSAFDFGLAWSFSGKGSIHVHSDYLIHRNMDQADDLLFYYGLGARIKIVDDARIGARIPVGLQYFIPDSRLGLFFEIAPLLDIVPSTDFDVNGGIGVRYFF